MTLEARSNDVRSLKGDAGWRRESSWSSRHGPASLRFFILNPAMDQGQAGASGRAESFHFRISTAIGRARLLASLLVLTGLRSAGQEPSPGLPCGNWEEFPNCTGLAGSAPRCTINSTKKVRRARHPIWKPWEICEIRFPSELFSFAHIECVASSPPASRLTSRDGVSYLLHSNHHIPAKPPELRMVSPELSITSYLRTHGLPCPHKLPHDRYGSVNGYRRCSLDRWYEDFMARQ
jgi:hypothetical protein